MGLRFQTIVHVVTLCQAIPGPPGPVAGASELSEAGFFRIGDVGVFLDVG